MNHTPQRPKQLLVYLILFFGILFTLSYTFFILNAYDFKDNNSVGKAVFVLKTVIEVFSVFYGLTFLFVGIAYLLMREKKNQNQQASGAGTPPVGIIYLCCNDLEEEALRSIAKISYAGEIHLIIHDDSLNPAANADTDNVALKLAALNSNLRIQVLRRKEKSGAKSGAMNYVLAQTAHLYDYFILCDNDSTTLHADIIDKSLPYFQNKELAIVQYKSVGVANPSYCTTNRILRKCIDAFHAMMTVYSKYGWQPFIGHNAMLRTQAVMEVGGFTPGFFSDDLDLTVRLNLKGYRVAYGGELEMGENHPPNYEAFRKRAYKWSYGCMQSVKAHALNVLKSRLSLAEKFFFFIFTGYYTMQVLLLLYMAVTFLIAPFFFDINPLGVVGSLIAGSFIVFVVYLPFLSYFWKEMRFKESVKPVILGSLVYGTTDFLCTRGTIDCLLGKKRKWIPTNQVVQKKGSIKVLSEPLFGLALLLVPLFLSPSIYLLPCAYLWAGKFLFVPALQLIYRDKAVVKEGMVVAERRKQKEKLYKVASVILLLMLATIQPAVKVYANNYPVEIKGESIYVEKKKFFIKGIHYSPWRPNTGPNKEYKYPALAEVDADLKLIKEANANTILVYDAPEYVLDVAEKYNLRVLYTFAINWYAVKDSGLAAQKHAILNKINFLSKKKALLGWVIGNEIPEHALIQSGKKDFETAIKDIFQSLKGIDPSHPVTHSNWPPAKSLDLSFLDFISFNIYPVWPPEVVAQGYGNYIKNVITPIAGNKPLLITEFGVNSLEGGEEGQDNLVKKCWEDIKKTKSCGAFVFAFADEWWKNYDNPQSTDNYWYRQTAQDDELTHDRDPEEHYGLVTADRKPKMAYYTVQRMYKESVADSLFSLPALIIAIMIVAAAFMWYKGKRSYQ